MFSKNRPRRAISTFNTWVRKYQETVSEGPLLRLIQDIQQRIDVYHNILEGLKRDGYSAEDIKTRYEGLGLVPTDHLPNPLGSRMAEHALAKLREYGTGLVKLMAGYAKEIKAELRISVNVKFNITVNFVGVAFSGVRSAGCRGRVRSCKWLAPLSFCRSSWHFSTIAHERQFSCRAIETQ